MSVISFCYDIQTYETYPIKENLEEDLDLSYYDYTILSLHDLGDDQILYLAAEKTYYGLTFRLYLCVLDKQKYKDMGIDLMYKKVNIEEDFWDNEVITGRHPMQTLFVARQALAEIEAEVQELANKTYLSHYIEIDALDEKRYQAYTKVASKLGYVPSDKKSYYVKKPLYIKEFAPRPEA